MKFSVIKSVVAASAIAAASVASAAAGDTFSLTGGTGTITFGAQGLSGLGVVGVNVIPLAGSATTGASPTLSQPLTALTAGGSTVSVGGAGANIAGAAVTTLTFGTAGVQLVKATGGANVAKLTNFSFDVASKTLFGDVVIGTASSATRYALYVGTDISGSTDIPSALGTQTVTNLVTGLKLGGAFADAIGAYLLLPQAVVDYTKTLDFGQLESKITGTNVAAVPEPSTYALMGLGLAGAAFVARRRKAA